MTKSALLEDIEDLISAEDFLEYFDVDYDPYVVHVNRLHILQRFHNYLESVDEVPTDDQQVRAVYTRELGKAYNDFVSSDARTEKVFRVFRMSESAEITVPLTDLVKG